MPAKRKIYTMNRVLALILVPLLLICASSCRREKVYRIGVSQCSQDDWREKMNDEIEREIIFHNDATVEIRSADDDTRRQIDDIRYFADNGFDIIVASPVEAEAMTPVIEEVYKRGIPVIVFDRTIRGDSFTASISTDNVGLGRQAGEYALTIAPGHPRALEIFGRTGSTPAADRHAGFSEAFTAGGGTIVGSASADWKKEDAMPKVDSLLELYPDVDIIYAHNDRMAIGASEVARSRGLDDIQIIGIDAAPAIGIRAVADSVIDATFLYPTEGQTIIRTALDILKGRPYQRETMLPLLSVVDRSNADILLLQDSYLRDESNKMKILKNSIDEYWQQHSAQTSLFYAVITITVLLIVVLALLLRAYWQRKRHQQALMRKNVLLQEERDKQRELNERLQAATQSKLVFFTNVSHDLRTPLTLIADPLEQLDSSALAPGQKGMVALARKNVKILMRLINQILDFRKYENGKLDLNLTEVDFNRVLADWTDSFRSAALSRQIHLRTDIPAEPCSLAVDVEKMERVFFNLMSNAIKHTPANGTITVSAGCRDGMLAFGVADTGCGIAPDELEKIFENFYQVDKIHPKGSGIGLWLSRAFVELHKGRLDVNSTPGSGSTFTVSIPVSHVADKVAAVTPTISAASVSDELHVAEIPEADSDDDDKRPRVLVIDDNSDMLSLVGGVLGADYRILRANNGREGVRLAAKYVPDLIVCDVMMPVMDGNECCRRIKSELSTSHIPVLMLTACSMDSQRVEGYESGADAYLSKPFSADVLKARCAALIENRKRIFELWNSQSAVKPAASEGKAEMPRSDIDNEFYQRFLDVFESEMSNTDLSVDTIAGRLGLERSQFYRKIKSLTNYSPVELMRRLRLRRAHSMLATTDRSVSEIAYEVGFSSPAYFTKCYREAYGETPSQARDRLGR